MKTLKAIFNQGVDLIFGLITIGLLILYIIHTNNVEMLLDKANAALQPGGDVFIARCAVPLAGQIVKTWHEGYFLILVVGYVAFNIINKVKLSLRK